MLKLPVVAASCFARLLANPRIKKILFALMEGGIPKPGSRVHIWFSFFVKYISSAYEGDSTIP